MSNVRLFSIDAIPNIDKTVWTNATSISILHFCLDVATQLLVSHRCALYAVAELFVFNLFLSK